MNNVTAFLETSGFFSVLPFPVFLVALALWSVIWKGVGLWFSARNYQKRWFISILILNTLGILEIIYLVWFRKDKQEGVTKSLFGEKVLGPEEDLTVAQNPTT